MMERIKGFWKLRKQNDVVKLMFLFFLAGVFFLAKALLWGAKVYQTVQSPAEYGFYGGSQSGGDLTELLRLDWVTAASPFRESIVSLGENGEEQTFTCLELSREYLQRAYGIGENGAMKTFYVNRKAFAQLKQAAGTEAEDGALRVKYQQMDKETGMGMGTDQGKDSGPGQDGETESPSRIAKVLLLPERADGDEPFVCCVGEPIRLKAAGGIWILGQPDLNGEHITELAEGGLTPVTSQRMQKIRQEQALLLMELKYSVCIAIICLSVPFCLHYALKMKYDRNSSESP